MSDTYVTCACECGHYLPADDAIWDEGQAFYSYDHLKGYQYAQILEVYENA